MEKIKFNIDDYKKEVQESNKECIDTILCTKRLSQDDKFEYIENLNKLYDFCKLERPENIVFVSSPILLAFSSGAARYYWNEIMVKDSATRSATDSATRSATRSATKNATISATDSASRSATDSATRSATDSATYSATYSATRSATISATENATENATDSATISATENATENATYSATRSATISATRSATDSATISATENATENATYSATRSATISATRSATRRATISATRRATISATSSATRSATISATENATYSATRSATHSATRSATHSATRSATRRATISATSSATDSATYSATYSATDSATHSATYSATSSATRRATSSATDSATYSATEISTGIIVPENYVKCILDFFKSMNISVDENLLHTYIKGFNSIYQGGNNWASWDYYLNLYRKIGKPIPGHDYTGFDLWNKLNVAGARVLERDFAMISEKPTSIVMKNDLAHNLQGPAVEFMDGVKYYMAYGNFIPSWIVTTPIKDITKEKILNEKNVDHRRYLIERIGIEKYIDILGGANVLDVYESKIGGRYELLQIDINGEKCNYLKMINQTEFVYHIEGVTNECETVKDAIMFRNGMKSFAEPKYLS